MSTHFKIVVPSFNSIKYLPKTLSSIESQEYKNYDVCVIDDSSTLQQQREIITEFCERNGWKSIFHINNMGALAGIVEAIRSFDCQDDDVIVMLDGDDWFFDDQVLKKLDKIYSEEDVYLTWGQFTTHPQGSIHMNYSTWIPEEVIEKKLYREINDIFGHLKTYKYRLFKEIKDEDLKDPQTGEYFRVSWDKALMYPMLEMAGPKVKFVSDVLYVYNVDNPLCDFKINRPEQIAITDYIRSKPKYERLPLVDRKREI